MYNTIICDDAHGSCIPPGLWNKVQIMSHLVFNITTIIHSAADFPHCMISWLCINSCTRGKTTGEVDCEENAIAFGLQRNLKGIWGVKSFQC